jgi:hypothetical protein
MEAGKGKERNERKTKEVITEDGNENRKYGREKRSNRKEGRKKERKKERKEGRKKERKEEIKKCYDGVGCYVPSTAVSIF